MNGWHLIMTVLERTFYRQIEGEGAALSQLAVDGDIAAVGLGDMFDDGQPQAGAAELAAARLVHPVEPFEQTGEMLFGDAHALVLEADLDFIVHGQRLDLDGAFGRAVLDRIVQQVHRGLLQQGGIDTCR